MHLDNVKNTIRGYFDDLINIGVTGMAVSKLLNLALFAVKILCYGLNVTHILTKCIGDAHGLQAFEWTLPSTCGLMICRLCTRI